MASRYDYPNTYREFMKMFPDDAACMAYLTQLRWPEGFTCPACAEAAKPWVESRGRLECSVCHHETSLTGPVTKTDIVHGYDWG